MIEWFISMFRFTTGDLASAEMPRMYTALAEWSACTLYIFMLSKKKVPIWAILLLPIIAFILIVYHYYVITLPLWCWVPTMCLAIAFMYLLIKVYTRVSARQCIFWTARAFVLAEFAAAISWQLYYFLITMGVDNIVIEVTLMVAVFTVVFSISRIAERRYTKTNLNISIKRKDLLTAVGIAVMVFFISNLSFISADTPLSGKYPAEIFYIRTLVNFCGIVLFYTQQEQRRWHYAKDELNNMKSVINRQYEQFVMSRDNIEYLNTKYHDLKHQLNVIINEESKEKREQYLQDMRQAIKIYGVRYNSGNAVLDVILSTKGQLCVDRDITLTCVADGSLLDAMDTMDICSVFGNALDNAIESVSTVSDKEQRIIKLSLFKKNNFIMIKIDNYCSNAVEFIDGLPQTTKSNKDEHGYGVKSIKQTIEKYQGETIFNCEDNWFSFYALVPLAE